MTAKRFQLVLYDNTVRVKEVRDNGKIIYPNEIVELLNALHEENMNKGAEITRFKLIVSDIVDDLEKQAKNEEPIVISMAYVDWIKSELDLKLNGLKR